MPVSTGRRIIWEEDEFRKVAFRAAEYKALGQHTTIKCIELAQKDTLPRDRQRSSFSASAMGERFNLVYQRVSGMSQADRHRFAEQHGLRLLADDKPNRIYRTPQEFHRAKKAESALTPAPNPFQEQAPAFKAPEPPPLPVAPPEPVVQAPAPAPVLDADRSLSVKIAIPQTAAELQLGKVMENYLIALLRPSVEAAIRTLREEIAVPMVSAMLKDTMSSAFESAVKEGTSRLEAALDTKLDELTDPTKVTEPEVSVEEIKPAPKDLITPATGLDPSKYTSGFQFDDNILIFGLTPPQYQAVLDRLRNDAITRDLKIAHVQDVPALNHKINARTHLIHMVRFSAHLPKGLRDKVSRIYPNANGITTVAQLIRDIVTGNNFVQSY